MIDVSVRVSLCAGEVAMVRLHIYASRCPARHGLLLNNILNEISRAFVGPHRVIDERLLLQYTVIFSIAFF
jgi:hypothetical protein